MTWPGDAQRPSHTQPIVPHATFMVRCACGFAHDSDAATPEAALKEIRAQHPHDATTPIDGVLYIEPLTASAYPGPLPTREAMSARVNELETKLDTLAATTEKMLDALVAKVPPLIPAPDPAPEVTP